MTPRLICPIQFEVENESNVNKYLIKIYLAILNTVTMFCERNTLVVVTVKFVVFAVIFKSFNA